METAIQLLVQKPELRREIYVVSDLTTSAWKSPSADLKKLLTANPDVLLYVIDVGVEKPRNFSLGELSLSGDVSPAGADVLLSTPVAASGVRDLNGIGRERARPCETGQGFLQSNGFKARTSKGRAAPPPARTHKPFPILVNCDQVKAGANSIS